MINPKEIDELIKCYFLKVFEQNLNIKATYQIIKPLSKCIFLFEYHGQQDRLIVDYIEEYMGEFTIKMKTTSSPEFYYSLVDIICGTFNVNLFDRVKETANFIVNTAKNYKIFDKVDITDHHFIGLKKRKDKNDGFYYHYAVNSNIVNCIINDRLYPYLKINHHFSIKTKFIFKKDKIYPTMEMICLTIRESIQHAYLQCILFDVDTKYSTEFQHFKRQLSQAFKAQLFTQICKEYNISMKDLMNMSEDEILPYALIVQMLVY